jgi:hypothetical protein
MSVLGEIKIAAPIGAAIFISSLPYPSLASSSLSSYLFLLT